MSGYNDDETNDLSNTTRRTFCTELILTSAGLMLAAAPLGRAKAEQNSAVAYPPRRIEGAETLLPGTCLYFNYPTRNDPAVLLRSNDGEYRAYSRRCSHAGCSVDFDPSTRCLKCPCHRGSFDARLGYVMFGPPPRPLDLIILQMRAGGQLWATGKSFAREREVIAALGGGE
jgi:arsenite oxidase small subunit